jgi:hypothetical protein
LHVLDLAAGDREGPPNAIENPRHKPLVCALKARARAAPTSNGNGGGQVDADGDTSPNSVNSHWRRSGHKLVSLPTTLSRPNIFRTSHFKFKTFALQGGSRAAFDYLAEHKIRNVSLDLHRGPRPGHDRSILLFWIASNRVKERRERSSPHEIDGDIHRPGGIRPGCYEHIGASARIGRRVVWMNAAGRRHKRSRRQGAHRCNDLGNSVWRELSA